MEYSEDSELSLSDAGDTFNKLNPDNLKAIGIDGLINEIRARKLKEVK